MIAPWMLAALVACSEPSRPPPRPAAPVAAPPAAGAPVAQVLPDRLGLGRAPTPEEIAAWDIDVDPTGAGLPPGRGGVDQGRELFKVRCAACHGLAGEGGLGPKLIGREPATGFAEDPKIERTIGNWWPYATTVFDYVRRAMPQTQPGSLTDDEVYALVAFLLHENGAAPDGFVADAESVRAVKMPTRVTFFPDDRPGAGVPELRR